MCHCNTFFCRPIILLVDFFFLLWESTLVVWWVWAMQLLHSQFMESLTKGKLIMVSVICKEILVNHKIVLTVAWCHVASLNGSADFSFLLTLQSLLEEMSCYWCFIMINAVELLNFIYAPSAPQLRWALLMFSLWTVGIIRRNEINLSADWGDWSSFKFCYLDGGFLGCRMCYVVVFH